MPIQTPCRRCKEIIVAADEDDLVAQVEEHAKDHGGARGRHIPTRERIVSHVKGNRRKQQ